jgi:hypothetical protein
MVSPTKGDLIGKGGEGLLDASDLEQKTTAPFGALADDLNHRMMSVW